MSDITSQMFSVIQSLDYSETSKQRLLNYAKINDARIVQAFNTYFINNDKIALRKELDKLLFGTIFEAHPVVVTQKYGQLPPGYKVAYDGNRGVPNLQQQQQLVHSTSIGHPAQISQQQPINTLPVDSQNITNMVNSMVEEAKLLAKNAAYNQLSPAQKQNVIQYQANQITTSPSLYQQQKFSQQQSQQSLGEFQKLKIQEQTNKMTYEDFLNLRQSLKIDDISIKQFISKLKESLPQNAVSNGFSPNEFIEFMAKFPHVNYTQKEMVNNLLMFFYYLDFNNNGLLDVNEILIGFILLSKASQKEKLEAAFTICDTDNSMTLDMEELKNYLRAVMRISQGKVIPEGKSVFEFEQEFEQMASATAIQIFNEIDLDHNCKISLEEFVIWHNFMERGQEQGGQQQQQLLDEFQNCLKESKKTKDLKEQEQQQQQQGITSPELEEVKVSLQFDKIQFLQAAQVLKEIKNTETMNLEQLGQFVLKLQQNSGLENNLSPEVFDEQIKKFFKIVDTNDNQFVEWDELLGGLSLICQGSEEDKINGVFKVFDENNDNSLKFEEMFKMFKQLIQLQIKKNPDSAISKSDPDKLAFAQTVSWFDEQGLPYDSHAMNFGNFSKWYKQVDML